MKAYQVFARMTPERTQSLMETLRSESPAAYTQAVAAASATMKARPQFLMKLPKEKRAQHVRRALSRVAASPLAEEVLASYFLDARKALLVEWLDAIGLEHDEGTLAHESPDAPAQDALEKAVAAFRKPGAEDGDDRELLLEAFAAQSAVDWPGLESLLAPDED